MDKTKEEWDRPISPEMKELARQIVKQMDEENEMLSKMTSEEKYKYTQDWAERLAKSMCDVNTLGGP